MRNGNSEISKPNLSILRLRCPLCGGENGVEREAVEKVHQCNHCGKPFEGQAALKLVTGDTTTKRFWRALKVFAFWLLLTGVWFAGVAVAVKAKVLGEDFGAQLAAYGIMGGILAGGIRAWVCLRGYDRMEDEQHKGKL